MSVPAAQAGPLLPFAILAHFWAQKAALSAEATHEILENPKHLKSYNLTSFALKHPICQWTQQDFCTI